MNIELNVYMRMMGKIPVNQDKFGENSIHFIVYSFESFPH